MLRLVPVLFLLLQPATAPTTAPAVQPLDFVPVAQSQLPNGSWNASPTETAVATLAFLSAGHPPAMGRFGRVLTRATSYLREPTHTPDPLTLLALANLAALDRAPETREAAIKLAATLPAPKDLNDAAWQSLAYTAADRAGIPIPPDALLRLDAYLVSTRLRPGTFTLKPGPAADPSAPTANPAALILLHTLGHKDSPEAAILATRLTTPPADPQSQLLLALAYHFANLPQPPIPPATPLPNALLIHSLPTSPIPVFQR